MSPSCQTWDVQSSYKQCEWVQLWSDRKRINRGKADTHSHSQWSHSSPLCSVLCAEWLKTLMNISRKHWCIWSKWSLVNNLQLLLNLCKVWLETNLEILDWHRAVDLFVMNSPTDTSLLTVCSLKCCSLYSVINTSQGVSRLFCWFSLLVEVCFHFRPGNTRLDSLSWSWKKNCADLSFLLQLYKVIKWRKR